MWVSRSYMNSTEPTNELAQSSLHFIRAQAVLRNLSSLHNQIHHFYIRLFHVFVFGPALSSRSLSFSFSTFVQFAISVGRMACESTTYISSINPSSASPLSRLCSLSWYNFVWFDTNERVFQIEKISRGAKNELEKSRMTRKSRQFFSLFLLWRKNYCFQCWGFWLIFIFF